MYWLNLTNQKQSQIKIWWGYEQACLMQQSLIFSSWGWFNHKIYIHLLFVSSSLPEGYIFSYNQREHVLCLFACLFICYLFLLGPRHRLPSLCVLLSLVCKFNCLLVSLNFPLFVFVLERPVKDIGCILSCLGCMFVYFLCMFLFLRSIKDIGRLLFYLREDPTVFLSLALTARRLHRKI